MMDHNNTSKVEDSKDESDAFTGLDFGTTVYELLFGQLGV
jgi:hypothetical protein